MEVRFIKTNPTENMTLLIETPIPREKQLALAERLIAYGSIYAEQAGYIEPSENPPAAKRLQMMAGEFCGNASLSLAAVLAEEKGLQPGEEAEILLEVSGAADLVRCRMKKEETGFSGKVDMPLPQAILRKTFSLQGEEYELSVVEFAGISHIIVPQALWGADAVQKAEQAAKEWAAELPQAFGILLFAETKRKLRPLVSVQGASLIWERGCGSGTAAIGAYLAAREGKSLSIALEQPGGSMAAEVTFAEGEILAIRVVGRVSVVARGTAYL